MSDYRFYSGSLFFNEASRLTTLPRNKKHGFREQTIKYKFIETQLFIIFRFSTVLNIHPAMEQAIYNTSDSLSKQLYDIHMPSQSAPYIECKYGLPIYFVFFLGM